MTQLADKYNNFMSAFNGLEGLLPGQREEVPKVAPPIQNTGGHQQPPPQNYGYPPPQPPPQYYGYQQQYGYPPPQQPPPQYYGYPQMGSPFIQPKMELSDDFLRNHARMMIKHMELKDKLVSTIPREVLRAWFDKREDKVLIADFERNGYSQSDAKEGTDIEKAYYRVAKVKKLDAIANKAKVNDDETDNYLEMIAIEQFKMEKEMGILKLPTLEEYWKMRRGGLVIDYSEFITDFFKGIAEQIGGDAKDFFGTIKSMIGQ